jgi:hypothetical protein
MGLRMGSGDVRQVDANRVEEILPHLIDCLDKTEQVSRSMWLSLNIESRSGNRRGENLATLVVRYLADGGEAKACETALSEARRKVAALLGAIGRTVQALSQDLNQKFAPDEIEAMVRMERKVSLLKNLDVVCWKRYCELAEEHLHEDGMEERMRSLLKRNVRELLNLHN